MSEKKKKGFWSWLGFGKKAENPDQEAVQTVENNENSAIEAEIADQSVTTEVAESAVTHTAEEKNEAENVAVETVEVEEKITDTQAADTQVQTAESEPEQPQVEASVQSDADDQQTEVAQELATVEENQAEDADEQAVENSQEITKADEYQEKPSRGGFFSRLIQGLVKTKQNIGSGFLSLFRGKKIDDDLFEELEEQLLIADLGMPTTTKIINNLTQHASRAQLRDAEQLYQKLKEELAEVLKPVSQPLVLEEKKPYVILMVGVNGVGKTTTIGKLARKFQAEGKSVMLAAGDTFRAAAVEQLQVWGERNHIPVIAQATGADSASVIFDAMQSAAAKGVDVLIADTAGRLQNKNHLMDELKKIVRVMKKYDESAPHEIMLTLDAGTGQNAISQAKLFHEAVGLTGITLTKLDGTAKGGVIFAIANQFGLPIRYIGVGEKIEDLREFNADEFIEALFSQEEDK